MSNPGLNRLLRGGGLTSFHVDGSAARRGAPHVVFRGERHHATFSASEHKGENQKHDYSRKENREESGSKKKKQKKDGDNSDSDSDSDDESGGHYNSSGIHKKGSDAGDVCTSARLHVCTLPYIPILTRCILCADGDGKKNEGKGKKKDFKKDDNSNGKPDFMEKKK